MNKPIFDEENELRDLMTRVMDAPLSPLQAKVDGIEARIRKLEEITTKNGSYTINLNDTVIKINNEIKNSLDDLNDDLPDVVSRQIAPLTQGISGICQQQGVILGTVNENQSQSLALAASVRDSMGVCDGTLQTAMGQLQQLNINAQTSEKHALDTFVAIKANQISVEPVLVTLQEKSNETAKALQAQQLLIETFKHSLPTLLQGMRQELDSSLFNGLESTQISILAAVERNMAEQQLGLFTRLKLLKTLTFVNLFALTCVIGLTVYLLIKHS